MERPPKVDLIELAARGGPLERGGPVGAGGEAGVLMGAGVYEMGAYEVITGAAEGGRERFRAAGTGGS